METKRTWVGMACLLGMWFVLAGMCWGDGECTIEGYKFNDLNQNGVWDPCEPALSSWRIYLDQNNSGVLDSGETSIITNSSGFYQFTIDTPGTYYVREVNQSLWNQTLPGDPNDYNLQVEAGQVYSNVNFGNFYTGGTIEGYKFSDLNNNGVWDSGEPGLSGWTVYLDQNNNGALDSGEVITTTNSNGYYKFTIDTPGIYYVREVNQSLWVRTLPEDPNDYNLQVEAGQVYSKVNFGNFYTGGTIEGYKFSDLNNNGVWDPCEPALSGWRIYLDQNNNGARDSGETSTTTNSSGYYKFMVAASETYYVREVNQSLWNQTLPASPNYGYMLQTQPGQVYSNTNFGNFYFGCTIQGYKFNDLNNNGVWDSGEPGLSGWTVYLDQNNNGALDSGETSTTTNSSGYYKFIVAAPATYYVREVNQSLWNQTLPASPNYGYTLQTQPGQVYSNTNFGNFYFYLYGGGSGTAEDPYQIATVADWQALMATSTDWTKSFILTADLDLQGITLTPVGNPGTTFTGSFNGNGHIIRNATINTSSNIYAGLFGDVNTGGRIYSLGVESANIKGLIIVGALVGRNTGTVSNCYATATVASSSPSSCAGGLVGYNSGTVSNCYATATVASSGSNSSVGGLIGSLYSGTVSNCYAVGTVSGGSYIGGLVGYKNSGTVTACFWDTQTSGKSNGVGWGSSTGITGKTTAQMQDINTFLSAGWDFVLETANGTQDIWMILPDQYPHFAWQAGPPVTVPDVVSMTQTEAENALGTLGLMTWATGSYSDTVAAGTVISQSPAAGTSFFAGMTVNIVVSLGPNNPGSGSEADPYKIGTVGDWQALMTTSANWDKYYILIANLDLRNVTLTPVGNSTIKFTGSFNGGGHIIRNATMSGSSYIGLFGCVDTAGRISSLGLESSAITGLSLVGGLAGVNGGLVSDCYATGKITGTSEYIGGLIGSNAGTVSNCYTRSTVIGNNSSSQYVGGLIGYNLSGLVSDCHTEGNTSGYYYVGGLIGYISSGTVSNCHALGRVTGSGRVGGLIGYNTGGTVSNCYASGMVNSGLSSFVGGLIGSISSGTVSNCYSTGAVTGPGGGGLIGYKYSGTVSNCFWDTQTSGKTTSADGTGKTTAEMKTLSTFTSAGWDFAGETVNGTNDYWRMCVDGVNYPQLTWDYVQYGDFACPDGVSTDDLLRLGQDWLLTYSAAFYGADANGDKTVNLADFEILAQNWLDEI